MSCIGDPTDWICEWTDESASDASSLDDEERIRTLLRLIYIPELPRTRFLQADLSLLRSMDPHDQRLPQSRGYELEMKNDIYERVMKKPHLLVAYTWIMYSAILFGGREICAQLLKAGPEFWGLSDADFTSSRTPSPLSFWNIDDYMAVRTKFRERILKADALLTSQERQEILDESGEIFRKFELMTTSLDEDTKNLNI